MFINILYSFIDRSARKKPPSTSSLEHELNTPGVKTRAQVKRIMQRYRHDYDNLYGEGPSRANRANTDIRIHKGTYHLPRL